MGQKKMGLRLAWIIPNLLTYIASVFILLFVTLNFNDIKALGQLWIYGMMLVCLLGVSLFGSFRIRKWIRDGQM
jgi:hypothetical protein